MAPSLGGARGALFGSTTDSPTLPKTDSLYIHLDAQDSDTLSYNSPSTTWTDKVNNVDFSGDSRGIESMDGNDSVRFNGSSDGISGTAPSSVSVPFSHCVVAEVVNESASTVNLTRTENSNANGSWDFYISDSKYKIWSGSRLSSGNIELNAVLIFANYGSSALTEKNGIQQNTGSSGTVGIENGASLDVGYATPTSAFDREFDGRIGEVITWNEALDSQQRTELFEYAKSKWSGVQ